MPIPPSPAHGETLREARVAIRRSTGMDLETWTEDEMRDARAHYAGLVKQIDHEVGQIIETLRHNGLLDNTVIVFSTDHGDHIGDHGIDGKATFYEPSTHIPLLIRVPAGQGGTTCGDLVELRDITATMLTLAGCEVPGFMDSRPLPGLGLEGALGREHIIGMLVSAWMAFDGRYKLSKYASGEAMLFDLQNDPEERENLIADRGHREIFQRLDATLTSELMRSMSFAMHDRMPSPHSMADQEAFGQPGWAWQYPAPVEATAEQDFYL